MRDYEKIRALAEEITKKLADDGSLIEAGFRAMCILYLPREVSSEQLDDMRCVYYLGADHIFTSVLSVLEPDAEPTDKDLERMTKVYRELEAFRKTFNGGISDGN